MSRARAVVVSAALVASLAGRLRAASGLLVGMAEELEGLTRDAGRLPAVREVGSGGAGWGGLAEYRLAQAIEGEGAGLFENRVEVGLWIAHTALNRVERGWWGESLVEIVERDFHGWVNVAVPADWSREIARTVLGRKEDITSGALFVLSKADLEEHGWSRDDALFSFEEGEHGMFFFRVWPGETE